MIKTKHEMSRGNKADYSVYKLVLKPNMIAVALIEAKKITPHSIAQVIAFYSPFEDVETLILVVVMAATE